jgi:hypothetical protein
MKFWIVGTLGLALSIAVRAQARFAEAEDADSGNCRTFRSGLVASLCSPVQAVLAAGPLQNLSFIESLS